MNISRPKRILFGLKNKPSVPKEKGDFQLFKDFIKAKKLKPGDIAIDCGAGIGGIKEETDALRRRIQREGWRNVNLDWY